MVIPDARSIKPSAQEALRKRAVAAYLQSDLTQAEVATLFGVSRMIVSTWLKVYHAGGEEALASHVRGPAKGTGCLLTPKQAEQIRQMVIDKCPEQMKLPFYLWTREALRDLIQRKLGITVSINTAGNYFRAWGFTPQKPVRRAYEQNPEAVQRWLEVEYPALVKRAKAEDAIIYWGDEMGMRSDHQTGRSYGLCGQTPMIPGTGQRFRCNMISAVTNRGHLCFQVFEGSFNVALFLDFLTRLWKQAQRKVILIVDGHPVHRAKLVQAWRLAHQEEVELIYLPSYSPELNPDEMLNNDVKSNAVGRRRPKSVTELMEEVLGYLLDTQERPDIVASYFEERHVRYARAEAM
jgi:transposase